MPGIGLQKSAQELLRKVLDNHCGQGGGQLKAFTTTRSSSSEKGHKVLLREKPYKAILLERIAEIMSGERKTALLDEVANLWP